VGYLRHVLTVMQDQGAFEWTAAGPADWEDVPADWPDTRFATKARALGHPVWRLIYRRR
jgi:tRNA (guanine-N7-)-methyltransferase